MMRMKCDTSFAPSANLSCNLSLTDSASTSEATVFLVTVELYLTSLFCVVGICGNILSIIVLRRDRDRRDTLFLLQALAVADTFYLCIVVLRYPLKYILDNTETFAYMQLVVYPLHQTAQTITIWMMVLVTIDRFIFVCRPLRADILTGYWCRRLTSASIFFLGALYNMPHYFSQCVMIIVDSCSDKVLIKVLYQEEFNNIHYYYIYRYALCIALLYVGPLSLLIYLNYKMIQVIKKSTRWRNEAHNYRRHSCAHSDDKNATFTLIIIVMVFVVCETPELLFKITTLVSPHIKTLDELLTTYVIYRFGPISELLTVINSSVNFFIYCAFSRRFLNTMKGLFVRRGRLPSMTTQELMGLRDLGGGGAGGGGGGIDSHVQGQLCQG